VWHDLGALYQARGLLPDSCEAFERAISLDPELTQAYVSAAAAEYMLGHYPAALARARQAVALDPAEPASRVALAYVAAAAIGAEAGLAELAGVLANAPQHVAALAARAHLLVRLERYAEARLAAIAGLDVQSDHGFLLESLAGAYRGLGRFADAVATYDRAIAEGRDRATMLALRANAQLEAGATEYARASLEAALSVAPDTASAWHTLSEIRPFTAGDPAIATMEAQLETSPRLAPVESRTLMHFALGRAYHKAGDAANAFRNFAQGNALKRAGYTYDVLPDERFAADSIAYYTRAFVRDRMPGGNTSAAPIFVVGMPRSGTTLVEQVLASHPAVHAGGELTFFERALAERGPADPAALGRRYLELTGAVAPGDKRVVDKLPGNFRHVALIHLALPNARIVHCTRDVLDTGFSCYSTLFSGRQDFAYDLGEIGRFYRAYAALMAHWRAVLPAGIMLDVRYEDLVADLARPARAMLAFLGLPWDPAVLRYYETVRPIRTASYHQARRPIYTTSVGSAQPYRAYLQPLVDALTR
jgi:tetratricopeptide (TPR) repeat protein